MGMLTKHKKKGLEGFQNFVRNIETASSDSFKNILQAAMIEDPIYITWALKNLMHFEDVVELEDDPFETLLKALPNRQTWVYAFGHSEMEPLLLGKVSKVVRQQFLDELALVPKISPGQQLQARNSCIVKLRDMQKNHELDPYKWQLPAQDVLDGSHFKLPNKGEVVLDYESGTPALRGSTENHMRTGNWEIFYPNGQKYAEGAFKEDQKDGVWKFYGPRGEAKMVQTYEDGHLAKTELLGEAAKAQKAAAAAAEAASPADPVTPAPTKASA
ncbi:MAG: hypothetical protein J6Y94_01730 [Bacteriovoracaceae bacterium]|nr:hypothetical protein [Bacteriovoracaceae bacterium]